jgi:hypothetical protein
MTLVILLYITGGLLVVMFLYKSFELVSGVSVIPKRTRTASDKITKNLVKQAVETYNKVLYAIWNVVREIPTVVALGLLSVWMWALRFTIKIVSLLQGKNGYVRSMIRGHLEAISEYRHNVREEEEL